MLSFRQRATTADHATERLGIRAVIFENPGVADRSRVSTTLQPTRTPDLKRAGVDGDRVGISSASTLASPSYLRYW